MTIEEIILVTPIPKHQGLLNSVEFLQILMVKYNKLRSLMNEENRMEDIRGILSDLEGLEKLITTPDNLTSLMYVIGTKYTKLGLKFENEEFLVKGITALDLVDEKILLTDKFRAEYYHLFSRGLLIHFNNQLDKDEDYRYSYKNIEPLLKSKYFLFKLYNFLIEKKIEPVDIVESKIISDLITVLIFLSRWNEPFFILDKRTALSKYKPGFIGYLKAHTLNEIAYNTCCSIYPAMAFEIKKQITVALTSNETQAEWKAHLTKVEKETDKIIQNNEINLDEFEKSYGDTKKDLEEHDEYRKWVLKSHFALCEHAIYCFCGLSKSDDLQIKSNHKHTELEWVKQFDILLQKLKGEFNLSRYFLYLSEADSKLPYVREDEVNNFSKIDGLIENSNSDFLIQAFKSAYSILDKIGRAIYLALGIQGKDVYFHKCWREIKAIEAKTQNRYLYTLYSIACDLSETSEYSAFKQYKQWRNLIEHEFFFLIDETANIEQVKRQLPPTAGLIKVDEFKEKTHYMLQLCRSAIFSFVFFIRHESKSKEKDEKKAICIIESKNKK